MEIIKRHKDSTGRTMGYTVSDRGKQAYLDSSFVVNNFANITNARLLPNGEFRANTGSHIETVIDNKALLPVKAPVNRQKQQGNPFNTYDFYGSEYINVCRRIRRYAAERKLEIVTDKHKSNEGKNIHLFELIKACGMDVKTFIIGYLSVLQPFSLKKFKQSEQLDKGNIWLCDLGYRVNLVIKLRETDKNRPMIISFHESNIHSRNSGIHRDFSDKPCAVLIERYTELQNGYGVDYIVQRGFIRYKMHSSTLQMHNNVALINYIDVKSVFNDTMKNVYRQLEINYLDSDIKDDSTPVVVAQYNVNDLSFMSIGYATVNNVCLLLDLYSQYTDTKSRAVVIEITTNVIEEMPLLKQKELKSALEEKYRSSYNNELYKVIRDLIE
jgi:hypothetical protein